MLEPAVNLDNLYPALVQCFGIILLGYIAGKFSFINDVESKGLSTFVGTFSLPALIFVSLCQLDFSSVNWLFLAAIFIAKSTVFFSVLLVSIFMHRPFDPSKAGLYAIFCTQSNDFALGYPVLQAIYGTSHPKYPMYLYLIAPVSLVILNPIGFVFMEIGKNRSEVASDSTLQNQPRSKWLLAVKVFLSIAKNPIIFMTVFGIVGNLLFHGSMPAILHSFLSTLGSAFSASALFLLGLRMVGQTSESSRKPSIITPLVLVVVKSLVLPLVTREVISQLDVGPTANDTLDLSNYGFLYGTIPTAPSVFVYALNYGISPDVIASTITASTFTAAPLMYVTAKMLSITNLDPNDYIEDLDTFLFDISTISLVAAVWVIFVLLMKRKAYTLPHCLTLVLVTSQGVSCLGVILWSVIDCTHGWKLYIQFLVFGFGVLASRVTTAMLAVCILILQTKSVCAALHFRKYLIGVSVSIPLITVIVLMLVVPDETPAHGDKINPNFQYGTTQAVTALVMLLICLLITVWSLVMTQRYKKKNSLTPGGNGRETDRLLSSNSDVSSDGDGPLISPAPPVQDEAVDVEDLILNSSSNGGHCSGTARYRCDDTHRNHCRSLIGHYEVPPAEDSLTARRDTGGLQQNSSELENDEQQIERHKLLLLFLSISMFTGAALCIWTLVMDQMGGIYLELAFLDGFLNLGQAILTFGLFGVDTLEVVVRVKQLWRNIIYRQDKIMLPAWEDLDQETRTMSTVFLKHHVEACMADTLHDINEGLGRRWLGVVRGNEMVSWLKERGLAHTRQEAESLGRLLLRGRVLRHVDNHLDFYDDKFVYTFRPDNP